VSAHDIRSVGIRVHLGVTLLLPSSSEAIVDLAAPETVEFEPLTMGNDGYVLDGWHYVLGCTRESVRTTRSLVCHLDGRSSIARQGLFVHCSSMLIDNVHDKGRVIVLELFNCSRRKVRLRAGLAIGMLAFHRLEGAISQPAAVQYADQQSVLPPRAGPA
jgi:dCTP deaminase